MKKVENDCLTQYTM